MKIIKSIFAFILCFAFCEAEAQIVNEIVTTNDVKDFSGIITSQLLVEGKIVVRSDQKESVTLNLTDVIEINIENRNDVKYFIYDKIVKKDNTEYIGFIVKKVIGTYYQIKNKDTQELVKISNADIKIIGKELLCDTANWKKHSPFIETLVLKDGKTRGLLLSQDIEKGKVDFLTEDGKTQEVSLDKVLKFEKEINPGYKPETVVEIKDNQVVLNGNPYTLKEFGKVESLYYLESKDAETKPVGSHEIVLEANDVPDGSELFIVKIKEEKLQGEEIPKNILNLFSKKQYEEIPALVFEGEDMVDAKIIGTKEGDRIIFRNENIPAGKYAFYFRKLNKGIIVEVK